MKGKHGELKRDFKHLPIELFLSDGGKKARLPRSLPKTDSVAASLQTACATLDPPEPQVLSSELCHSKFTGPGFSV